MFQCGQRTNNPQLTAEATALEARLKGEFDHQPMLLLVGTADGDIAPVPPNLAVLGGNTNFYKPRLEGIWYLQHTRRTSENVCDACHVGGLKKSLCKAVYLRL